MIFRSKYGPHKEDFLRRCLYGTASRLPNCLAPRERIRYGKWNDDLSIMFVAQNNDFPCFHVIWADMKQYLINKLSRVIISVIQGTKLFSMIVRDVAIHRD